MYWQAAKCAQVGRQGKGGKVHSECGSCGRGRRPPRPGSAPRQLGLTSSPGVKGCSTPRGIAPYIPPQPARASPPPQATAHTHTVRRALPWWSNSQHSPSFTSSRRHGHSWRSLSNGASRCSPSWPRAGAVAVVEDLRLGGQQGGSHPATAHRARVSASRAQGAPSAANACPSGRPTPPIHGGASIPTSPALYTAPPAAGAVQARLASRPGPHGM